MTSDELATYVALGLASAEQVEQLAARTVDICFMAALCATKRQPEIAGDAEDAAMIAAEKAMRKAGNWRLEKAHWETYVSCICRHEIANCWRAYQRRERMAAKWAELSGIQDEKDKEE